MTPALYRLPGKVEYPATRLLCFTYAGGNGNEYRVWNNQLSPKIEQMLVQMPGRGRRFAEDCAGDLYELIDEIVESVRALDDLPLVFFGHSMGCIIAYETAHALIQRGMTGPSHLFLSGRKAAHLPLNRRSYYDLPDHELLSELKRLGSANNELLDNRELVDLMLPILRADFKLHDNYRFTQREKLTATMTVLGGTQDPTYDSAELARWSELTTGETELIFFRDGHFFTERFQAEIADIINQKIAAQYPVSGDFRVPDTEHLPN